MSVLETARILRRSKGRVDWIMTLNCMPSPLLNVAFFEPCLSGVRSLATPHLGPIGIVLD